MASTIRSASRPARSNASATLLGGVGFDQVQTGLVARDQDRAHVADGRAVAEAGEVGRVRVCDGVELDQVFGHGSEARTSRERAKDRKSGVFALGVGAEPARQLGARAHSELAVDPLQRVLDRMDAEEQRRGGLLVASCPPRRPRRSAARSASTRRPKELGRRSVPARRVRSPPRPAPAAPRRSRAPPRSPPAPPSAAWPGEASCRRSAGCGPARRAPASARAPRALARSLRAPPPDLPRLPGGDRGSARPSQAARESRAGGRLLPAIRAGRGPRRGRRPRPAPRSRAPGPDRGSARPRHVPAAGGRPEQAFPPPPR